MKAEFVYKNDVENSMLQFLGEYVREGTPLYEAIIGAGWEAEEWAPPEIPEDRLDEWMKTSCFHQPAGHGLFGGSTKAEGKKNILKLREVLINFGVEFYRPRQLELSELL